MTWIARACAAAIAALAIATASGCGFIQAGQKSVQKPNTFILLGHADVGLPASDHAAVGATCIAPPQVHDIGPETPVTVRDGSGAKIATGVLGTGIVARSGQATTCAFPFQVSAVPGGSNTYTVAVGSHPAQSFPASQLRQNAPAVITISR